MILEWILICLFQVWVICSFTSWRPAFGIRTVNSLLFDCNNSYSCDTLSIVIHDYISCIYTVTHGLTKCEDSIVRFVIIIRYLKRFAITKPTHLTMLCLWNYEHCPHWCGNFVAALHFYPQLYWRYLLSFTATVHHNLVWISSQHWSITDCFAIRQYPGEHRHLTFTIVVVCAGFLSYS